VGTTVLSMLVTHLFVECGAERVLIDPRLDNDRAIRSFEKVGFRKRKVLAGCELHEGQARDCWLMELDALDHPVGLTARLAEIDSVNPSLVPGAVGEGRMAEFVAAWCEQRGFEVHRGEVAPGRFNVVAIRRGRGGGRSLLFNSHLDTVGTIGPATKKVRLVDGRLEGRGVLDTKGGLAAALLAAASADAGEFAGDVIVAGVADEEYGSIGTEALVADWPADAAVVVEPTSLTIISRHRGFAVVSVTFTGRSAHTSQPERGVNAVHAAARASLAVNELDARWAEGAGDPVERPSALVSRVQSTGEIFTVPALCELIVEVRTTEGGARHQIDEAVRAILGAADDVHVEAEVVLTRSPLGLSAQHPLVTELAAALGRVLHREPIIAAAPYWTDAALHAERGTPAVVFGPTGEGLHEDLEWVTTDSLVQCTAALTDLVRRWCGPGHRAR
jgi:acetylornithine deacetylase